MMQRSSKSRPAGTSAKPMALAAALGLVLSFVWAPGPASARNGEAPLLAAVDDGQQTTDDGGSEPPCNTTTTTTLPPVVGVGLVDPPADDVGGLDPCPPAEESTDPEPATTTATTTRSLLSAADDKVEAVQGKTLEPFDVTENDLISPSLGRMAVVSGEMPNGLRLWVDNSLEGWIIGTPTECGTFEVQYSIEATANTNDAPSDTATATVEVACNDRSSPLTATDDEIDGTERERLEIDLVANDSPSSGIAWIALSSGDLPGGLTLWAGGWLTGIPTETGEFRFSYVINGAGGATETANVILGID